MLDQSDKITRHHLDGDLVIVVWRRVRRLSYPPTQRPQFHSEIDHNNRATYDHIRELVHQVNVSSLTDNERRYVPGRFRDKDGAKRSQFDLYITSTANKNQRQSNTLAQVL